MTVREDKDGSLLTAVMAAPRALIFLTVPWSMPERRARASFREAVRTLAAEHAELGIEFFTLEEDSDWCQAWLATLGQTPLGNGYPLGAGSMLWLESGRVVGYEIGGAGVAPEDVVARTLWLWSAE